MTTREGEGGMRSLLQSLGVPEEPVATSPEGEPTAVQHVVPTSRRTQREPVGGVIGRGPAGRLGAGALADRHSADVGPRPFSRWRPAFTKPPLESTGGHSRARGRGRRAGIPVVPGAAGGPIGGRRDRAGRAL